MRSIRYTKCAGTAQRNAAIRFLLTQPIHQQQQFGGSVGGPIIKDRLFYFFTYDGFRRVGTVLYYNNNALSRSRRPPPATQPHRHLAYAVPHHDHLRAVPQRHQLPPATPNATSAPPSRFAKQNIFFPRLDWHINSKNDMFVNYNFANFDCTYGYNGANTFTNSSPTTNGPTSYHERFLIAGLTTQVSDRSVNQVHFQYGRDLETAGANAAAPSVGIGAFTYGMPNALPRIAEPDEHRTQITDVFSTIRGHHSFKFGGDVNLVHEVMINLFQGGGVYSYSGTNTASTSRTGRQTASAVSPAIPIRTPAITTPALSRPSISLNTGNRAGARRLLDEDVRWLRRRLLEDSPEPHAHRRRSLRRSAHAAPDQEQHQLRSALDRSTAAPSRTY